MLIIEKYNGKVIDIEIILRHLKGNKQAYFSVQGGRLKRTL